MFKNLKLLVLFVMAMGAIGVGLSACNTTAGFGQDVKEAGSAIHEKAEEEKRY